VQCSAKLKRRSHDTLFLTFVGDLIRWLLIRDVRRDPKVNASEAQLFSRRRAASAFATINEVFNAWPCWREYVQNVVARMGLPSITVPVFRVA
jgi:hypothetical protein